MLPKQIHAQENHNDCVKIFLLLVWLCLIPTWHLFWFHTQIVTCLVWKIFFSNQKEKLLKEECSREYSHGLWEVIKFLFLWAELANLIETRRVIYYFSTDCAVLGSSCFASEAYYSRTILCGWHRTKSKRARFVLFAGHLPCHLQTCTRGLIGITAVNRNFTQASILTEGGFKEQLRRVELFGKSDCEIATSVNVKLEWWN